MLAKLAQRHSVAQLAEPLALSVAAPMITFSNSVADPTPLKRTFVENNAKVAFDQPVTSWSKP
jgi:hypothetical protein